MSSRSNKYSKEPKNRMQKVLFSLLGYNETEARIQEAFFSLLEKKPIDEISVRELCFSAHISLPSFYAHYDDINDLATKQRQR